MWLPTLLVVAWWACTCSVVGAVECADDEDYSQKEVLFVDNKIMGTVAVDWKTNKMFMMKHSPKTKGWYEVGVWDVDTSSYSPLGELPVDCRLTVDQRNGDLYLGCWNQNNREGRGGLYLYDKNTQRILPLTDEAQNIWWIHFADKLYYITDYPEEKLYSYEQGHYQPVSELDNTKMRFFEVDGHGNWIYSYDEKLYVKRSGVTDAVEITTEKYLNAMAVDPNGDVYGCSHRDAIYRVNTTGIYVSNVVDNPPSCISLTFDKYGSMLYYNKENKEFVRRKRCRK